MHQVVRRRATVHGCSALGAGCGSAQRAGRSGGSRVDGGSRLRGIGALDYFGPFVGLDGDAHCWFSSQKVCGLQPSTLYRASNSTGEEVKFVTSMKYFSSVSV